MQLCSHFLFYSYLLNIFDLIATLALSSAYGADIEGNPLGKMLIASPHIAVIYKVFVIAAFLGILYVYRDRKSARVGTYTVFAAYLLLAVYHVFIIVGLKA